MKKILVLGYYGYVDDQLDGQTVKTRSIYSLLQEKQSEIDATVSLFDTQTFKLSKFNVFKMFLSVLKADTIFYLGAHNNLKFMFPFLFVFCIAMRKDMHYVVVGGWLFEFLRNKPLHRFMLKRIKSIYPQTDYLTHQLTSVYGFNNVYKLNNFRLTRGATAACFVRPSEDVRRLVFMARVHPMKGVDVIFKIADKIKKSNISNVVIDIYGPIVSSYEREFKSKLAEFEGIVSYRGVLQPNEIYQALHGYDFMIFPTRYFTEGFPGSILDSYLAGVPVVASGWKYAEEFVEHNSSGLICDFNEDEVFISTVFDLIGNSRLLGVLKEGAVNQAVKYSSESAWETLRKLI